MRTRAERRRLPRARPDRNVRSERSKLNVECSLDGACFFPQIVDARELIARLNALLASCAGDAAWRARGLMAPSLRDAPRYARRRGDHGVRRSRLPSRSTLARASARTTVRRAARRDAQPRRWPNRRRGRDARAVPRRVRRRVLLLHSRRPSRPTRACCSHVGSALGARSSCGASSSTPPSAPAMLAAGFRLEGPFWRKDY